MLKLATGKIDVYSPVAIEYKRSPERTIAMLSGNIAEFLGADGEACDKAVDFWKWSIAMDYHRQSSRTFFLVLIIWSCVTGKSATGTRNWRRCGHDGSKSKERGGELGEFRQGTSCVCTCVTICTSTNALYINDLVPTQGLFPSPSIQAVWVLQHASKARPPTIQATHSSLPSELRQVFRQCTWHKVPHAHPLSGRPVDTSAWESWFLCALYISAEESTSGPWAGCEGSSWDWRSSKTTY